MRALLTTLLALSVCAISAQETKKNETKQERQERYIEEVNPFRHLGYKPKIATLSKGKYREAFPDTIVRIGNIIYNKITKKVIAVKVIEDLGVSEADLRADVVSRWMSPDPLSQEFPEWSPYNFTNDNPIFFNDPTGLAAESVLDDFGIDKNGNIMLLEKTDDNFDRLYAVDDDGNKVDVNDDGSTNNDDSVVVNDQTILPELSEVKESRQDSYHGELNKRTAVRGEGSQDDMFKIFSFAADNTNVEFGLYRFNSDGNNQFGLGTYGNSSLSPGAFAFGFESSQIIAGVHSHPGIPTTQSEEIGSMYGDRSQTFGSVRRLGQAPGLKYVYFPNSSNIYNIDNKTASPSFIRKTNGNHKRFYFGTLNSQ